MPGHTVARARKRRELLAAIIRGKMPTELVTKPRTRKREERTYVHGANYPQEDMLATAASIES